MNAARRIPYTGKNLKEEPTVPIVLVYLVGIIGGIPYVLLMRRGHLVSYMPGAWSIIAGVFFEGDFRRQTFVEVAGETSLLQGELREPELVGTFTDEDAANEKTWIRNLVVIEASKRVSDSSDLGVRLDWEHSEAAWVPVSTIAEWLDGKVPEDPVAKAILTEEPCTSDFKLNLERVLPTLLRF